MIFEIEQAVEILSRTPKVLNSLLRGLSKEWTETAEDQEKWTPFDVVGHFIHGEETDWIPRARLILAQGENQEFESFDRLAQFEKSRGKTLSELLDEFARLRADNIETLLSFDLTEKHLELKGIHPELGEVNLRQLLATWVVHDLNHIRQITNGLAEKYVEDVGAWKNYLTILN